MTDERKKFKTATSAFTVSEDDPVSEQLRHSLSLIASSFRGQHMRKLDILKTENQHIYGLLTHYEGNNICWVQPTFLKDDNPERAYDLYMKKINNKHTELKPFPMIEVGLDCVAQYEVDKSWYRGVVVGESENALSYKVLFIDYGNIQACYCDQIRQPYRSPNCDHFHAPVQAVCCRLYNIVPQLPSEQKRIDTHLSCWSTMNHNTYLEIKVKDIRPDYVIDCDLFISPAKDVEVIDANSNEGEDANRLLNLHIGQNLVNRGVAKFDDPVAAHAIKLAPPSPTTTASNIKSETKPDTKCETKPVIKTEVKPNVETEGIPDIKPDVEMMEKFKPDVSVKLERS